MIGKDAFCPETGARLAEKNEYDEWGRIRHEPISDEFTTESQFLGELTNGAVTSSKTALFNHFRRSHQRHFEANDDLYRKAALSLRRLKRTAEGRANWDVHVWYALLQRLTKSGFDIEWMHAHAELYCPHCHGYLKFEKDGTGEIVGWCVTDCTDDTINQLREIRKTVVDLYGASFEENIDTDEVLQFNTGAKQMSE